MPDIEQIIGIALFIYIIYLFWSLNKQTRKKIESWAEENGFEVISYEYHFWHWAIPWIAGGFHPANFKVKIKRNDGRIENYWIRGGGLFLFSDSIKVEKASNKIT